MFDDHPLKGRCRRGLQKFMILFKYTTKVRFCVARRNKKSQLHGVIGQDVVMSE